MYELRAVYDASEYDIEEYDNRIEKAVGKRFHSSGCSMCDMGRELCFSLDTFKEAVESKDRCEQIYGVSAHFRESMPGETYSSRGGSRSE
jgi:hypothetical protein